MRLPFLIVSFVILFFTSCKSINKTQQGGVLGAAGGSFIGAMIGSASGNPEAGSLIGSNLGTMTGSAIGREMDKQALDLTKELPGIKVERAGDVIVFEIKNKVLFQPNQSTLSVASVKSLDDLARVLNKYPDTNIEIRGYTDDRGRENVNQVLSEKRASAVAKYLIDAQVETARIHPKGFGETSPKYSNLTDSGRMENRRVEFLISATEKMAKGSGSSN